MIGISGVHKHVLHNTLIVTLLLQHVQYTPSLYRADLTLMLENPNLSHKAKGSLSHLQQQTLYQCCFFVVCHQENNDIISAVRAIFR